MQEGEGRFTGDDLAEIADSILERAGDDEDALASELDRLAPPVRERLLSSDFLNAYQVYYYFFRKEPGELERDRLLIQPASALVGGVLIDERDLFIVIFRVEGGEAVVSVSDGERVLANFRGKDAHERALRFIDESV